MGILDGMGSRIDEELNKAKVKRQLDMAKQAQKAAEQKKKDADIAASMW